MRKMKNSGIAWIGEIPNTWTTSRIKYVADFEPKCDFSIISDDTNIEYAPMECIKYGQFEKRTARFGTLASSLTPFQDGDIVMAKVTPCFENGNIAIMDDIESGIGLGSSELFVFRAKTIEKEYLFFWLQNQAFIQQACSTMTGTGGLKRVSPYFVKNCEIHLPPIPEQIIIASFLKRRCVEIDSVIAQTRASIEEYKHLKQAVITQAVTKGVRGDRPMKESGIEWVDKIPQEIQITRVGMFFEIILGKMLCSTQVDNSYTLEPYYCAADVHFNGIATTERKQMWFSPAEKDMYLVKSGDLLVVEGGAGAGGCAIVSSQQVPTYIQNSIMIVRPKGCVCIKYLRYWIEFLVKQGYIDVACNKATIPHFTKDKLAVVPIPVFSAEESEQIAAFLDEKCAEIDALIAKKEQLLTELESYKKSLIYEYVTGKKEV